MDTKPDSPKPTNVFASPWKKSDVVFVVEEEEFHVHRLILAMQSQVFENMLNGQFKEAKQDKITLEGKNSDDMLEFLKLLYPPGLIKTPLISLSGDNVVKMLALADEYQTIDVMEQWLKQAHIEANNALKILPYVDKYYKQGAARKKCIDVIKQHVSTSKLDLQQQTQGTKVDVLLAKCTFLESNLIASYNAILWTMYECLNAKKNASTATMANTCGHYIEVKNFHQTRKCEHCMHSYNSTFIDVTCSSKLSLSTLKNVDDVKYS